MCNQALVPAPPQVALLRQGTVSPLKPAERSLLSPPPAFLRGDPGELSPCSLMRTRLQGQEIGDAP